MTRVAINDALWGVSLVLQFGLLAMVFARGIARRLPCFTVLLGFYPLRALVLFVLFGRVSPANYAAVYEGLSVAGLLLQLVVAVEIGLKIFRLSRWVLVVPVAAWVGVMLMWAALPVRAPVPPDRLQMFCSAVMILLCVWAVAVRAPRLVRMAMIGLGAYGAVDLMATAGKAAAAMHRDAAGFAGWSYASSGVYICVVAFWMLALR